MSETIVIFNNGGETFPAYLRRKADEAERNAASTLFAASEYFPPSWWRASANADRDLADAIEGGAS